MNRVPTDGTFRAQPWLQAASMKSVHSLLSEQVARLLSPDAEMPAEWQRLLEVVNTACWQADLDRKALRDALAMRDRELARRGQELQQVRAELQAVVQAFPDLLVRLDADGVILEYRVGASLQPIHPPADVIGRRARDVLPEDVASALAEALARVNEEGTAVNVEYAMPSVEGERYCEARLVPLANGHRIAIVRDVTERKQAEEALRESEIRKCAILGSALDAIMDLDDDGHVTEMNPAAERMFGGDSSRLAGMYLADLVFPAATREIRRRELADYFATGQGPLLNSRIETVNTRMDGTEFPVELAITHIDLRRGRMGFTAFLRDLTERKQAEQELTRLAFHDTLTGLPNRALFSDRLEHALANASRTGNMLAVMFLDLDNFKVINDSIGHEAGDQLLIVAAERLRACLRTPDTVARFGGDEFTILLEGITALDEVISVADRVAKALRASTNLSGHEVFTTASIGIAVANGPGENAESLLRKADLAMYRSKDGGKAQYTIFDQSMNSAALERLQLESDLHFAVERGELRLMYQPIVLLDGGHVGELEALVRWDHPTLGVVPPTSFISIAEENGLIVPIGRWVLEEACRQLREWQQLDPSLATLPPLQDLAGHPIGA